MDPAHLKRYPPVLARQPPVSGEPVADYASAVPLQSGGRLVYGPGLVEVVDLYLVVIVLGGIHVDIAFPPALGVFSLMAHRQGRLVRVDDAGVVGEEVGLHPVVYRLQEIGRPLHGAGQVLLRHRYPEGVLYMLRKMVEGYPELVLAVGHIGGERRREYRAGEGGLLLHGLLGLVDDD